MSAIRMKGPKKGARRTLTQPRLERLRKLGSVQLSDLTWIGGSADNDAQLERQAAEVNQRLRSGGYEALQPLEMILLAIIDAHDSEKRPDTWERLETAVAALRGTKRKRGQKQRRDDVVLSQIARRYFVEFHTGLREEPELRSIVVATLEVSAVGDDLRNAEQGSVVQRLERKFRRNKDLLLARASSEQDDERFERLEAIEYVIRQLNALGVPADRERVRGRRE